MKKCTQCNITKSIEFFSKKSKSKDGLSPWCCDCKRKKDNERYQENKEKIKAKSDLYYYENKEKILKNKNKDKIKEYNKEYKQKNKENIAIYNKEYKQSPEYRIRKKELSKLPENKLKNNIIRKNWIKNKPEIKLSISIRKRLRELLNLKGFNKNNKFEQYIGCSLDELKLHISKQFTNNMNWDNYGKFWHIDHILPLANALNEEQMYKLSHYLNLRPMMALDNIRKNNRADICWQKLQRDRLIEEDKQSGHRFDLNPSDFIFSNEILTIEHRNFIERYEWLGSVGFSPHSIFTARHNGILAGVVIMGQPNLFQFDKNRELLIQRGACSSWAPKNLNSSLLMFACKWIIKNTDKRIFVAYSDPRAGEVGTIYQACNFDYLGDRFGAKTEYKLPNGKFVNRRYFMRMNELKKYAYGLNIEWNNDWKKREDLPEDIKTLLLDYANKELKKYPKHKPKPKGKYVLLLNYGKDKVKKTWIPQPYPKRVIL